MSNDNLTIDKYKLVTCVASGQSSQVWEAIDEETTRRVAMKLLLPERLKEPEEVAQLKSEFKVASAFDHPNIPKYFELVANKKQAYFTMELFPASNVKAQLFNDIRGVQMRFKRLAELVASALEHIHDRGWLHRDVKPDNILMNKSSEVRLIDFSLACRAAGALSKILHRKQSTVQGTRTYMAPEQIRGLPLTPQTDIYNFGVTLFELLTGQPPFKGSTPKELLLRHVGEPCPAASDFNSNITSEMDLLLQRMLAKKPEQRHKSIAEFMSQFRNVTVFKEEVTEKVELSDKEKAEQELKTVLGERLDSRTDALRTKFGVAAPTPAKPKKAPVVKPAAVAGGSSAAGQGRQPPAPGPMPMPPQPMAPPVMPMPGMYPPGAMPMGPYPGMPMPPGPVPWVMGAGPGMPGGPWVQQPPGQYGQPPMAPAAPPVAARPAPVPPPTAIPAVPVQPPARPKPPAPSPQQKTAPPAPAKAPAPKSAPPIKPGEGFNIEDLAGFDELPPVS